MRSKAFTIFTLVAATMLFGELKYQPFQSEFRISFGSGIFFFWLIWFREIPILLASLLTGSAVVLFRIWLDFIASNGDFFLYKSALTHVPSFAFYLFFGLVIWMGKAWRHLNSPLRLGLLGAVADFSANLVELLVRKSLMYQGIYFVFVPQEEYLLLILAFVRSFFIVGFFNIIQVRHLREISREQQLRFEKMLMISSDLHVEALYLKKVMGHIEQVTRNGYTLYRELKAREAEGVLPESDPPLSRRALSIAEEVHEIKKDSQRILSGVSKIIQQERVVQQLTIEEIVQLVVNTNQKYAHMLEKEIAFTSNVRTWLTTRHVYSLLSVLNNLLSNAVEAIERTGSITLRVYEHEGALVFRVSDTGGGIAPGDEAFIFIPGYTTKYDEQGNASTGIGLAHARDVVTNLGGTLEVVQGEAPGKTIFEVRIPIHRL
ncbi:MULTISPECIES: ATP-binding protein [Aneurinibacillus]|uniref:histidine kinase n=1 Tax=Aneurinibacillus danicus TaxID=267746 RepID=A0A511V7U0_9BACL|nr:MULTISPECIES: sensor histidine kinase [Aneurinibacillus]GEN33242.1 sensor histidine kinase [Aneurinibacillus danicus]